MVQIQEELDSLAQQATANAMYIIKSEKHVFTNNAGYMKLLNKMKAYVMRKQDGDGASCGQASVMKHVAYKLNTEYNGAADIEDEVSICCLPPLASLPACVV